MNEWWLIAGMVVVTLGVRYPVLALMSRWRMPVRVQQALEFVPVAVLSAIVMPMILAPGGELSLSLGNAHLLAAVVAIGVSAMTRNLLMTIGLGMGVFLVLRWVLL
ncbi:MAG: AzlD domain-containing protein [Gammaproteobacteria bacterium]